MPFITYLAAALAWLGRQGTRAIAISIFFGLAVPQLAATFKPFFGAAIFALLTLAFLRVDPAELHRLFVRPGLVLAATFWTMVVVPALLAGLFLLLGIDRAWPDLIVALVLQAASPPITIAPAFAALMGLDAALSLALLILSTIVTPITTPLLADFFLGPSVPLSPVTLGIKLFLFLAGTVVLSGLARWIMGRAWIERQKGRIDGINVIILFIFAIALMDGVAARILADPGTVIAVLALSFSVSLAQVGATTLVFSPAGWSRAFVLGLAVGHRNMGLAIATAGSALSDLGWLYFSLAQFPIYLLPQILQPVARRMTPPKGEIKT